VHAATGVWVIVGLMTLALLFLMAMFASMFRKAGPHEALIVYGFRGTRIVKGGGTIIFPMVENCKDLSLELMSFDVAPQQDLYTKQGVAVTVEAVAQIKVKSDPESIRTAAEQFLTKTPALREGLIRLVMEGHLRGIIGQLTVEQIVKEPEMVGDRMRATCADDMNKMGLEVISFTIKEVRDIAGRSGKGCRGDFFASKAGRSEPRSGSEKGSLPGSNEASASAGGQSLRARN
jgi:flotillin